MDSTAYLPTTQKDSYRNYYREEKFCDVSLVAEDDRDEHSLDQTDMDNTVQPPSVAEVEPPVQIRVASLHDDDRNFLAIPQLNGAPAAAISSARSSSDGTPRDERDSSILNSTGATSNSSSVFSNEPQGSSTPLSQSRIIQVPPDELVGARLWCKSCHKVILARNSPFFEKFLTQAEDIELAQYQRGHSPSYQSLASDGSVLARASMIVKGGRRMMKIELRHVRASSLRIILNFIYTGDFDCNEKIFGNVLEAARLLRFDGIVQFCEDFLNQPLKSSNCIRILLCSKSSQQESIYESCFNFIEQNFTETFEECPEDWIQKVPYEILQNFIDSPGLSVHSEEILFKMLISWVEYNKTARPENLYSLMKPRVHRLSAEFLLKVLAQTDVVRSDHSCLRLITDTAAQNIPPTPVKQNDSRKGSAASCGSSSTSSFSLGSSVFRSSNSGSGSNSSGSPSSEEETLCVFGSNSSHEILIPEAKKWKTWQEGNLGHTFEVVNVQDNLFVIGGCRGDNITARVEIYNFQSKTWARGPSLNKPRDNFAISVMDSKYIFVFGGTVDREGKAITNSCEVLDVSKSYDEDASTGGFAWIELPPMALQKYRCKSATVSDKVYVIGGQIKRSVSGELVRDFATSEVQKFHNNDWSSCTPMNEARSNFGIATLDDKIYVCGGWRDMNIINTCERFDPEQNIWEAITSLNIPRQSCSMSAFRGKLVVIGCYSPKGWTNCTEVYCPQRRKWSMGPYLEHKQTRPKCIRVNRKFIEEEQRKTSSSTDSDRQSLHY